MKFANFLKTPFFTEYFRFTGVKYSLRQHVYILQRLNDTLKAFDDFFFKKSKKVYEVMFFDR